MAVHRSEAQLSHLRLAGGDDVALRDAEEEMESAVENLMEFFDFTRDMQRSWTMAKRPQGAALYLV